MASFLIDPDGRRPPDEPSEDMIRVVWLLLALFRHDEVDETSYARVFERHDRTYKRDLKKLRKMGEQCGFKLGPLKKGVVKLVAREARLKPLLEESQQLLDLVRTMATALGGPFSNVLGPRVGEVPARQTFLRVSAPRLIEDSDAGRIFAALRDAYAAHARMRFHYLGRGDSVSDREVEPYGIVWHSGRFYLIAYDVALRKGWRQFALDRIRGEVRRAGTFTMRIVPDEYARDDVVGLFKTGRTVNVTIELSSAVATAVTCRLWQSAQQVTPLPGGRARITFAVGEAEEAIRWAMSFGDAAQVVDPPQAVRLAGEIADRLTRAYTSRAFAATSPVRSA